MSWWMWIVAGIILMLSEFVIPGFVVCFFGAGMVLTGVLAAIFPCVGLTWQIVVFAVAGTVFTLIGRRLFHGGRSGNEKDVDLDDFSGENATVTEAIAPDHPGKVEFRGSFWTAEAGEELAAGETVRIVKRENLTLTVTGK